MRPTTRIGEDADQDTVLHVLHVLDSVTAYALPTPHVSHLDLRESTCKPAPQRAEVAGQCGIEHLFGK